MKRIKGKLNNYRLAVIKQIVQLSTAGFGLVAALAWNELIRSLIDSYIRPALGVNSGIISQAIYAIVITALAVLVTVQLSRLAKRTENRSRS